MADTTKNTQETVKATGAENVTSRGAAGAATGYSTGGQTAGAQAGHAARPAREHSPGNAREYGRSSEPMDQMRQSVSEVYNRASHSMNETWEQAMEYGRENPGKATLIAFGAGVGVGLLLANGFVTRSRSRRIVPPVMNALSEIAAEIFR
jgi:ElaB/YqjD/DUF883 family membrane-anchored ribosome-binding protein